MTDVINKRIPEPGRNRDEDERWLSVLPAPPRPFSEQDEDTIHMWMHRVAEAGGTDGLQWAYRPENWPFGPVMRPRLLHIYGMLMRRVDDERKRKVNEEAEQRAEAQRAEARELRREKGWA